MATQLAKAYVQVIPTTKGIKSKLADEFDTPAKESGKSFTSKFAGTVASLGKKAFKTAGVGIAATIAGAIYQGGKLQQSIGGIETLFKQSAKKVQGYANQAYKTAGVSANSYLEQVTSFSAALISSLGGDTDKAAEIANQAIIDMADNANTFGTNIEDIQNAYKDFARQNYTLLDNLSLGYAGTREGAEKLLADAEKLTGVHYDIDSLSDVFQAIHVIQEELGVTGKTSEEAASTLSGSFAAMKAAAANFLGALALDANKIPETISNLAETAATFLFGNLIPLLGNVIQSLPSALASFATEAGKQLSMHFGSGFGDLSALQSAVDGIKAVFSDIAATVQDVFSSLDFSGIKDLAQSILPAVANGFRAFLEVAGPAIQRVVEAFGRLWNALQPIISAIAEALQPAFEILGSFLGGIFSAVLDRISGLFDLLTIAADALAPVVQFVVDVFQSFSPVLQTLAEWIGKVIGFLGDFGQAHLNLKGIVDFVKSGIERAWSAITAAANVAKGLISSAIDGIKGFFMSLKGAGDALKNGLSAAWNAIKNAVSVAKDGISNAINGIKNFFSNLKSAGSALKSALSNAWSGIVNAVSNAKARISGLIDGVKNIFHSLGNINLFDIGASIMSSLWEGLKSAWHKVTSFVGGIGQWIRDHKGPPSYDRKLLIPAGRAIMQGLNAGLQTNFVDVQKTVMGLAPAIEKSFGTVSLDTMIDVPQIKPPVTPSDFNTTSSLYTTAQIDDRTDAIVALNKKFDAALDLISQILDKDTDVYLDREKVSTSIGRTLRHNEDIRTRYENRRVGVID